VDAAGLLFVFVSSLKLWGPPENYRVEGLHQGVQKEKVGRGEGTDKKRKRKGQIPRLGQQMSDDPFRRLDV